MTAADVLEKYLAAFPDLNPRCLATLADIFPLHRLPRGGAAGVVKATGAGIRVQLWPHTALSTFDFDRLTAIVVAAHRHACRVAIEPGMNRLYLAIHPREHEARSSFEHHPSLDALAARIDRARGGDA